MNPLFQSGGDRLRSHNTKTWTGALDPNSFWVGSSGFRVFSAPLKSTAHHAFTPAYQKGQVCSIGISNDGPGCSQHHHYRHPQLLVLLGAIRKNGPILLFR
jgi:hypothetical protein